MPPALTTVKASGNGSGGTAFFSAYTTPFIIMDTDNTVCSDVNPVDTIIDESTESSSTESSSADSKTPETIPAEEMEALRMYFERYAQEMLTSFQQNMHPGDDLPHYLLRRLEESKKLLASLELPWERYIPVLYRAFALYFIHVQDAGTRQKAMNLTSELMSVVVLLSQSHRLINHLRVFYHDQSVMLKKWIDENK